MFTTISKFFTKISTKLLSVDDQPTENCLSSLLEYKPTFIHSLDLADFLMKLRVKHLVNDIIITDLEGSVIATTTKETTNSFKSAAMYNYINSELEDLTIILIESENCWNIIFRDNTNIYFMKANDSLTKIEVNAIVDEINNFLKCII